MNAVNMGYAGDEIWYVTPDGKLETAEIAELEYPYFYSSTRYSTQTKGVISSTREAVRVLNYDEIEERTVYKTEFDNPSNMFLARKNEYNTLEADINYIERRLGADKIVTWTHSDRYADVDIETDKNGKIILIGSVDNSGKYDWFKTADDFVDYLETEKITTVRGWNSNNFDYPFISKYTKKDWWNRVLKLDNMFLYHDILQKHLRPLNVIAKENGLEGKKEFVKDDYASKAMIDYNMRDCELTKQICEMHGLSDIRMQVAALTGVHPYKYMQSFFLEGYIMLNRDRFNVYLLDRRGAGKKIAYQGADPYLKKYGLYEDVAVYDFSSLYPTIFMNMKWNEHGKAAFAVSQDIVAEFMEKKNEYSKLAKSGDKRYGALRYAFKILANGTYGVFANEYFRYYVPEISAEITRIARDVALKLRLYLNRRGFTVIYQDTDSAFVIMPRDKVEYYEKEINTFFAPYEIKFEHYFKRVIFRGEENKNIRKRYAGITDTDEKIVKGFELIRGDWTSLAKRVQEHIFDIIYFTEDKSKIRNEIEKYIRTVKEEIDGHSVPLEDLLITKTVKGDKEYKSNSQHLKAFKQLGITDLSPINFVSFWLIKGGNVLAYVEGGDLEPVRELIDWKAYWEKQVKAPVDRILTVFNAVEPLESYGG